MIYNVPPYDPTEITSNQFEYVGWLVNFDEKIYDSIDEKCTKIAKMYNNKIFLRFNSEEISTFATKHKLLKCGDVFRVRKGLLYWWCSSPTFSHIKIHLKECGERIGEIKNIEIYSQDTITHQSYNELNVQESQSNKNLISATVEQTRLPALPINSLANNHKNKTIQSSGILLSPSQNNLIGLQNSFSNISISYNESCRTSGRSFQKRNMGTYFTSSPNFQHIYQRKRISSKDNLSDEKINIGTSHFLSHPLSKRFYKKRLMRNYF